LDFVIGVSEGGAAEGVLVEGKAAVVDVDDRGECGGVRVEARVEFSEEGGTNLEVNGKGEGALNDGHGESRKEDEGGAEGARGHGAGHVGRSPRR
jgi:hypothetical protein